MFQPWLSRGIKEQSTIYNPKERLHTSACTLIIHYAGFSESETSQLLWPEQKAAWIMDTLLLKFSGAERLILDIYFRVHRTKLVCLQVDKHKIFIAHERKFATWIISFPALQKNMHSI